MREIFSLKEFITVQNINKEPVRVCEQLQKINNILGKVELVRKEQREFMHKYLSEHMDMTYRFVRRRVSPSFLSICLLGHFKCVVDLNAKIPHGTLKPGMA